MAKGRLSTVLRYLHHLGQAPPHGDLSDGHLLGRFVTQRDEAAFAVLVQRHGALVLGVCRRVLRQEQDAEDAFQATFLILARKASSIRKLESLAGWLHGVAQRTALNVRKGVLRRREYEKPRASPVPESPVTVATHKETQAALDAEVQRLPECYRVPFVLCCLEGKTRPEAAKELAWKEGTVSSRLARARHLLQHRLAQRGITLAAALSPALADNTMAAAMSATVTDGTVKAASLFALRSASVAGIVSGKVVGLAEGVLQMMLASKVKKVSAVLATLIALGMVAVAYGRFAGAQPDLPETAPKPAPQVQEQPKEVDMGLAAKLVVKSKLPLQVIPTVGPPTEGAAQQKPLTPDEIVAKKFEGKATIEFQVGAKGTGAILGAGVAYGGVSGIQLSPGQQPQGGQVQVWILMKPSHDLFRLGIDPVAPGQHFLGKIIRVTGQITRVPYNSGMVYELRVESLDQIEEVRKANP
jgi:RNA polymerase sigma factor (sigma-70 family)